MNKDVTVILNGFRRPERLKEQFDAMKNQTIVPKDIMYWQNSIPGVQYDMETAQKVIPVFAGLNFGVWARFAYALNARTNWICILDDDTIPGTQWLENCLYQNETNNAPIGLLGTIGVVFQAKNYGIKYRVGWDNPNEELTPVDIVGHAWFFHRDMLSTFWRELPPIEHNFLVGEDIHFSWMLQKYTNLKTFVPPHPKDNKEMWGSLKGWEYGNDLVALAGNGGIPLMQQYMQYVSNQGFEFLEI